MLLLLARGACIETFAVTVAPGFRSCSSQEEHVLKQYVGAFRSVLCSCTSQEEHVLKLFCAVKNTETVWLLLARGACIETSIVKVLVPAAVLLLARGACIETCFATSLTAFCSGCTSQEEHVLKPVSGALQDVDVGCSSQEEHVLKLNPADPLIGVVELLLARGACIETSKSSCRLLTTRLLLARGACIETCLRHGI